MMFKRLAPTLTALTLALTLSLGMPTVGASAAPTNPDSSAEAVERCRQVSESGLLEPLGLNMGECVNLVAGVATRNLSRYIVGICGSPLFRVAFAEPLGVAPDATKGQCISTLQAFVRAQS